MRSKHNILLLCALLVGAAHVAAEEANLISNPGFEKYSSAGFLGDSFEDWSWQGAGASAEKSDKVEGETSMCVNPSSAGELDQAVALADADYAVGSKFELIVQYKVISMPSGGSLSLDCQWTAAGGGDADAAKAHEADILQREVANEPTSGWQKITLVTTKPEKTAAFRVRFKVSKNAKVLFDDFSLKYKPSEDPYIIVTPDKLTAVDVNIGEEKAFATLHIKQGHVTSATTFRIGGDDKGHFKLSATEMAETESDLDLIVTYAPTSTGTHTASLIFDNVNHTTILPDMISLKGTCSDPNKKPELTVTPTTLPEFTAVEGQEVKASVHVSSLNCIDYVYSKIEHISAGAAFTIDGSMHSLNFNGDIEIRFSPKAEGTYQSRLIIATEGADTVFVMLNGKAEKKSEENIDWSTDFKWDLSEPLSLLNETFDSVAHNKTVVLKGWQNVAAVEHRPWWGFDEDQTSPKRGTGKYAKATAYQYGAGTSSTWETWLVTPALDYKNAQIKSFIFSVMGEYLPEEGSETKLEIYYIDANITAEKDTVFFQDLTEAFSIPKVADEANTWVTFVLDLSQYASTVADIFHMGFHYIGPSGSDGAVTYYIDNVSWGTEAQGIETIDNGQWTIDNYKFIRNGQVIIVRDGKEYNVLGQMNK